jgi:hypothetical protein
VTVDEELSAIFGGTDLAILVMRAAEIEVFSLISLDALAAMRLSEMFSYSFSCQLSEESLLLSRTRILEILTEDLSLTSSFTEDLGTSRPEPLTFLYAATGDASLERDLENLGENSALRDGLGGSGT